MQTQPRQRLSLAIEAQRARQAALISDDTFMGGANPARRAGNVLRNPLHFGSAHVWQPGLGRRGGPGQT